MAGAVPDRERSRCGAPAVVMVRAIGRGHAPSRRLGRPRALAQASLPARRWGGPQRLTRWRRRQRLGEHGQSAGRAGARNARRWDGLDGRRRRESLRKRGCEVPQARDCQRRRRHRAGGCRQRLGVGGTSSVGFRSGLSTLGHAPRVPRVCARVHSGDRCVKERHVQNESRRYVWVEGSLARTPPSVTPQRPPSRGARSGVSPTRSAQRAPPRRRARTQGPAGPRSGSRCARGSASLTPRRRASRRAGSVHR